MKKWIFITIVIIALVLSGCNLPGSKSVAEIDPDDAMATEIARILTGTPIQIEISPTTAVEEIEPTEQEEALPEPTEPEVIEEPTPAPTDTPAPLATPTLADTDPILTLGTPTWVDNMKDGDNWFLPVDQFTRVKFEDDFMKLTALQNDPGWRVSWPAPEDFYLEATLQTPECEGNDQFGLMFRVPPGPDADKGYLFGITCDGRYSLRRWDGAVMHFPINWTAHDAIQEGADVVNKIGVMARGANLALYINGQKVNEVTDSNYLSGWFGIHVSGTNVDDLSVWVDQIRYWDEP